MIMAWAAFVVFGEDAMGVDVVNVERGEIHPVGGVEWLGGSNRDGSLYWLIL